MVAVFSTQALSLTLLNNTEEQIRQRLARLGLENYSLELNVKVPVPGSDGQAPVNLWATVIRPDPDKKNATILVATPYRREYTLSLVESLLTHNYNLMIIDIRGTGSSGGKWLSFGLAEQYDIAHVIDEWIPKQGWSDGSVGMIGPSYCAIIQLLAAGRVQADNETGQPLHLKAIMPIEAMSDAYLDIVMQGGNLDLGFIPIWQDGINQMSLDPPLLLEEAGFPPDPDILAEAAGIVEEHRANIPVSKGWITDYEHAVDGPFYETRSPMIYWPEKPPAGWGFAQGENIISSKLPVFLTSGWFDIFLRGTLNYYAFGLAKHDTSDKAMIIGPWYHGDGAVLHGIKSFKSGDLQARWFDWKIKGADDPFMSSFPVLLYIMGEERWRAEKSWPLPESRLEKTVLRLSGKPAAMVQHDWFSALNSENNFLLTGESGETDYTGAAPVLEHIPPYFHGRHSRSQVRWGGMMMTLANDGGMDERSDELGVLTFTTDPLDSDTDIAGPLLLSFSARTAFDRPLTQAAVDKAIALVKKMFRIDENLLLDLMDRQDVQWVAELNDVFPDGQAKNITSGWLSVQIER